MDKRNVGWLSQFEKTENILAVTENVREQPSTLTSYDSSTSEKDHAAHWCKSGRIWINFLIFCCQIFEHMISKY